MTDAKKRARICIVLATTLLLLNVMAVQYAAAPPSSETLHDISSISFAQHDPINITHSDNITSLELPGSGTHSDPYLIEGYQILNPSGGYCISVSMPNEIYVTIRLCRLSGAQGAAIYFDGRYCGIVSCEISSSSTGILIEGDGSRIVRCEITNCSTGINATGSSNRVAESVIQNCEWGIVSEGEGVYVEHNFVSGCSEIGIKIASQGDPYSGGDTVHSFNNTVTYSSTGIELHGQVFWLITNSFTDNRIGIKSYASESQFTYNHIYDNNESQARDDGFNNRWGYTWHGGNVWKHITPGQPLPINGSAGSVDLYPILLENDPPLLSHPEDVEFNSGDSEVVLVWEVEEVNPDRYYITDGVNWQDERLEETTIMLDVSYLSVGVHTIKLHVVDRFYLSAYDEVIVTVHPSPAEELPQTLFLLSIIVILGWVATFMLFRVIKSRREN